MFTAATAAALREKLIKEGDLVVITAGVPVGVSGPPNLLRVDTVGEVLTREQVSAEERSAASPTWRRERPGREIGKSRF